MPPISTSDFCFPLYDRKMRGKRKGEEREGRRVPYVAPGCTKILVTWLELYYFLISRADRLFAKFSETKPPKNFKEKNARTSKALSNCWEWKWRRRSYIMRKTRCQGRKAGPPWAAGASLNRWCSTNIPYSPVFFIAFRAAWYARTSRLFMRRYSLRTHLRGFGHWSTLTLSWNRPEAICVQQIEPESLNIREFRELSFYECKVLSCRSDNRQLIPSTECALKHVKFVLRVAVFTRKRQSGF